MLQQLTHDPDDGLPLERGLVDLLPLHGSHLDDDSRLDKRREGRWEEKRLRATESRQTQTRISLARRHVTRAYDLHCGSIF